MAIIYPNKETIERLRPQLTSGETALVNFLRISLDDSFEVFVQPFVNGDRPDVILMKKNAGVIIFEVKDWNLVHYGIDQNHNWTVKDAKILSPLRQVMNYKNNLYNLHLPDLQRLNINQPNYWAMVSCAVYFHNATHKEAEDFVSVNENKRLLDFSLIIGSDGLNESNFDEIIKKTRLDIRSYYFSYKLYNSLKRLFQPPQHTIDQGRDILYTKKQQEYIKSEVNAQRKIRGVAGCGKTLVLAKRAVNAHIRTGSRVLILTYNITLINYIHDKISEVRENFDWSNFYIINYHDFITTEMNNYGIKVTVPDDFEESTKEERTIYLEKFYYSDEGLFNLVKNRIRKFDAIFIDEVQDYKIEWLRIIKDNFLAPEGEYILMGDEKQNIYNNQLDDDKKPKTNIPGRWREGLNETYRLSDKAAKIAQKFQTHYFSTKYETDEIQIPLKFDKEGSYHYEYMSNPNAHKIISYIVTKSEQMKIHPNDICVLAPKTSLLQYINSYYQFSTAHKTHVMFESLDIQLRLLYDIILACKDKPENTEEINKAIEKIKKGRELFTEGIADLINALCYYKYNFSPFAKRKLNNILSANRVSEPEFEKMASELRIISPVILKTKQKNRYENSIESVRKILKRHFRMNPGMIKLSTIHSMKGWETNNLFLIIENDKNISHCSPELIYTAITRCRFNLFVVNLGNEFYHEFFNSITTEI